MRIQNPKLRNICTRAECFYCFSKELTFIFHFILLISMLSLNLIFDQSHNVINSVTYTRSTCMTMNLEYFSNIKLNDLHLQKTCLFFLCLYENKGAADQCLCFH